MDSRHVVKVLRNPFRILRAERFFFALQIDPETVFLVNDLFDFLGSLEFDISLDGFPFLHQRNGIIGDCSNEQILQS